MKELYLECCAAYGWTPSTKGFICFCSLAPLRRLWARKFQSTLPVWGATAKLHKYFLKFYRI